MAKKINNKLWCLITQLLLLGISAVFLMSNFTFNTNLYFRTVCIYGSVISLLLWMIIIILGRSLFSNVSFIFLSFVLFQFGIPILYASDSQYINSYILQFSSFTILKAAIFSIFCIQFFSLGLTLSLFFKKNNRRLIFANAKWANNKRIVIKCGVVLFILSALIYIPATTYGALVLHGRFSLPAIGNIAKQFYFPSALLILCYSKNSKLRLFVYFMYLVECILAMMTGGRTEGLVPLMVLAVYFSNYRTTKEISFGKNHRFIQNFFLAFFLLLAIYLVVLIAQLRVGDNSSSNSMTLKSIYESFVGELGFNFTTIVFVISSISLMGFQLGKTYISSIVSLIPSSIDPIGIVRKMQTVSGSYWLQNSVYEQQYGFGLGFSLIGESYYNFGNYGMIFILLFGLLIGILQYKSPKKCNNWEKYVELVLLIGFITVSRRDFYQLIKQIEYSIFFVALILYSASKVKKG